MRLLKWFFNCIISNDITRIRPLYRFKTNFFFFFLFFYFLNFIFITYMLWMSDAQTSPYRVISTNYRLKTAYLRFISDWREGSKIISIWRNIFTISFIISTTVKRNLVSKEKKKYYSVRSVHSNNQDN